MRTTVLFLSREWKDLRSDRRVWPVLLLLPLIGVLLPVGLTIAAPEMVRVAQQRSDPGMLALLGMLARMPEFAALPPASAAARYLYRATSAVYLLMPVALSTTAAAFSIVGEKQQRTLEPILATPITDRQFLLGKLLAGVVPTVGATWLAGFLACVLVAAATTWRQGAAIWPDRFWLVTLLMLAPLVAVAATLVTMRLSAKATDPQAAVQLATLAILPGGLLVIGVFGKVVTMYFAALVGGCVLVLLVDIALFRMNVRRFQREEILTRWR